MTIGSPRSIGAPFSTTVSGSRLRSLGPILSGYIVDAVHAKPARIPQELFVNRRPVRNVAVSHAVGEGYGAFLAKGSHPRFVLFLDIDPDRLDVNVHPTKREVRFSDGEMIHQLVRRAVRQALSGGKTDELGKTPFVESSVRRILGSIVTTLPTAESDRNGIDDPAAQPCNPIAVGERSGGALCASAFS